MHVVSLDAYRNKKNRPLSIIPTTDDGSDKSLVERIERIRSCVSRINVLMAELKGDKK